MKICCICEYREGLGHLMSRLGSSPICLECFQHRAEHPIKIHDAVRIRATWPGMADEVTCWAGHNDGYLTMRNYERRLTYRMPAITRQPLVLSEDEEVALARMKERLLAIKNDSDFNFYTTNERWDRPINFWISVKRAVAAYFGYALSY